MASKVTWQREPWNSNHKKIYRQKKGQKLELKCFTPNSLVILNVKSNLTKGSMEFESPKTKKEPKLELRLNLDSNLSLGLSLPKVELLSMLRIA
jgi:hypothetical protein